MVIKFSIFMSYSANFTVNVSVVPYSAQNHALKYLNSPKLLYTQVLEMLPRSSVTSNTIWQNLIQPLYQELKSESIFQPSNSKSLVSNVSGLFHVADTDLDKLLTTVYEAYMSNLVLVRAIFSIK